MVVVVSVSIILTAATVTTVLLLHSRAAGIIIIAVIVRLMILVRRQSFDLKRGRNFHEDRQLIVLHIHNTLVHELEQRRHHVVGHVFENDCEGGESKKRLN